MEEEEKVKTKKERYELAEITSVTGMSIKDNKTDSLLDNNQMMINILNDLEIIKKAVC